MIPTSTPYNEAVKTAEKPPAERAHAFTTISGRPIKALYTAEHTPLQAFGLSHFLVVRKVG